MLENSVWKQYHDKKTIHNALVAIYKCEDFEIINDEKFLYATLKRRLTKKELRAFIMKEAGNEDSVIADALHVNKDEIELIVRKAYRKVRQDEIHNNVINS